MLAGIFKIAHGPALRVALVVGTILTLINQTSAVIHLDFNTEAVVRTVLNYLVPFSVSTYSRLALLREQQSEKQAVTE
ncbi:MAG: nitrate/nitrite transporter NrtS [Candidatus Marinimicrobia bacterium]|nr:nitrate/nitrite transporter NrtS [Candidatus Neomarinimicrobiota bacterium]